MSSSRPPQTSKQALLSCLLALLLAGGAASMRAEPPFGVRSLLCRVVDEAGRPVPGAKVLLGGVDRGLTNPEGVAKEPEHYPGLAFRTDRMGRFTVGFGRFSPYEHENTGEFAGPGYGSFHLFVSKPGWAGGVSRLIVNSEKPDEAVQFDPRRAVDDPSDHGEWRRGEFAPLVMTDKPPTKPLDIVLKRGLEVSGRLIDSHGKPLPSRKLGVSLDLHYGSHTGAGGEIFGQEAMTDASGWFRFRHVYPNVFRFRPFWTDPPMYWLKTQVRGRWYNRIVDFVVPRTGGRRHPESYERKIAICAVLVSESPHRYFGKVTALEGNAIAGAEVAVQTSWHNPPLTYGDEHSSAETTVTDHQGMYSLRTRTAFANWISAKAAGMEGEVPTPNDAVLPPGRYNIQIGKSDRGTTVIDGVVCAPNAEQR